MLAEDETDGEIEEETSDKSTNTFISWNPKKS